MTESREAVTSRHEIAQDLLAVIQPKLQDAYAAWTHKRTLRNLQELLALIRADNDVEAYR